MNDQRDLTAVLKSRFPLVVIETREEARARAAGTDRPPGELGALRVERRRWSAPGRRQRAGGADQRLFDLAALAAASGGFSGAEIEQAIVSAMYESHAAKRPLDGALVADELARTRPLSVVMAERVARLREWTAARTVPAA